MRLLQRYILVELLKVFTFILSVLTLLLVFVGVFQQVAEKGLGPVHILKILPFIVPSLMPFTIPATLLLTVCVVYGRLSGDQEITVSKAAGINAMSLLFPALTLGGVLSLASLILSDQIIPWAVANIQQVVTSAVEDIFLDILRNQHRYIDPDHGISIAVTDVQDKKLIGPVFRYSRDGHKPITMKFEEATLNFDLENEEVILHMERGTLDSPGNNQITLKEHDFPFPLPNEVKRTKPRHMTVNTIVKKLNGLNEKLELTKKERDIETAFALVIGDYEYLKEFKLNQFDIFFKEHKKDIQRFNTEIQNRFALATSCFCFALLGAPFSILQGRRQFLTNFMICFVPILVIYYPIVLLMMNLCKNGSVDPRWGMWIANIVLVIASLFVLRKVLKH